jgi:hypothetical protein
LFAQLALVYSLISKDLAIDANRSAIKRYPIRSGLPVLAQIYLHGQHEEGLKVLDQAAQQSAPTPIFSSTWPNCISPSASPG